MPYSFFFSYSSEDDRNSGERVRRFFNKLWANLKTAHGPVDEPFFAPRSNEPANDWKEQLLKGLSGSQILVCLQSPQYFASDPCGQEMEAFLRRRILFKKLGGGEPPDCIIPVVWYPFDIIPKPVPPNFQGRKPSTNSTPFKDDGLYAAMLTEPEDRIDAYALELAKRISDLLKKNVGARALPPLRVSELDSLRSAWQDPEWPLPDIDDQQGRGPGSLTLVHPDPLHPDPFPFDPPPPHAVIRAARVAKAREWIYQSIGFAGNEPLFEAAEKINAAQQRKSPVVLMVTEALVAEAAFLEPLTRIPSKGFSIVVLSAKTSATLPGNFPPKLKKRVRFADCDHFEETLAAEVRKIRDAILEEPSSDSSGSMPGF